MSLDGIWLASASERRSVLLKDFITKKNSGIKLVCEPFIEDEISYTNHLLQALNPNTLHYQNHH